MVNHTRLNSVAALLWLVVFGMGSVQATTVYVSATGNDSKNGKSWATAKRTVQAGLNTAIAGDEVWVAAGTYMEHITLTTGVGLYGGFAGTEAERSQRNWTANLTILDSNQGGSVVTSPSGATTSTRIDGFTIRNGRSDYGGGISLYSSSPTIANNVIIGNTAWDGIQHQLYVCFGGYGGGIYAEGSSPVITDNQISYNRAGGCDWEWSDPEPMQGSGPGFGGGIYCSGGSPTIANNTITDNIASSGFGDGSGGGICCAYSHPTIANNTITGNIADHGEGGGMYNAGGTSTLANCILWGNTASSGFQISGGATVTYSCVQGGWTGTGNISTDPLFLNAASGNLRLQAGSACIDAGNNAAVPAGVTTDLDGHPRFTNCVVDMGVYEADYGLPPPAPPDLDNDCDVDGSDLSIFETCGSGPAVPRIDTPTCQRADFDRDNDVDMDDFGIFQRCYSGDDNPADPNCSN